LAGVELQTGDVGDVDPAGGAALLRDLPGLDPVHAAGGGEGQHPAAGGGGEQVPDDVGVLQAHGVDPLAAAPLGAVLAGPDPLDVAGLGDGDDDLLLGDEVLDVEVTLGGDDPGAAGVAELVTQLGQLVPDDVADLLGVGEDRLEVGDAGLQLV